MKRKLPVKKAIKKKSTKDVGKKYKNGLIAYDGIKFKSGLEVFCYKKLKEYGIPFEYEKLKFKIYEGNKLTFPCYFPDKSGNMSIEASKLRDTNYTPDFVGKDWIIETKGMRTPVYLLKLKLFRQLLEGNTRFKVFLEPHNQKQIVQCIEIIKKISNK